MKIGSSFGGGAAAGLGILAMVLVGTSCSSSSSPQPDTILMESDLAPLPKEKVKGSRGTPVPSQNGGSGGCTMESIRSVVNTRREAITGCYRTALQEDPTLRGKVAVQLGIDVEGRGLQRGIVETDLPESVSECILKNLRGLTFPGPFEKPCGVVYPFVFSASGGPVSR